MNAAEQVHALVQRILVVNDDGVQSQGISILAKVAASFGGEVWVVAPDEERSGASQSISFTVPLRAQQIGERRYAIKGTPSDCVLLALHSLLKDAPPTLVLSGVNHGENLADDLAYSGTSGAAMEAARWGVPAIAFSQVREVGQMPNFDATERHLEPVLRKLLTMPWAQGLAFNVNFPAVPGGEISGVEVVPAGWRPRRPFFPVEARDGRNVPCHWVHVDYGHDLEMPPSTDLAVVRRNAISVTPLRLNPTDKDMLSRMEGAFTS